MKPFNEWKKDAARTWPGQTEDELRRIYENLQHEKELDDLLNALDGYDQEDIEAALDGSGEIGVMYTTIGPENEHELQVSYRLGELRLVGYLDNFQVAKQDFDSLPDLTEDILESEWEDYYSWILEAPEVQTVQAYEDAVCDCNYHFTSYYNQHADELEAAYRAKSGDTGDELSIAAAGDWCREHDDDLGDAELRAKLEAYKAAEARYLELYKED